MSISLNNHEDRIKVLENGGAGSWSKGSNSNGNWVKESKTGLLIQWGKINAPGNNTPGVIKFPIAFSNTNYLGLITCLGHNNLESSWTSLWQLKDFITTSMSVSLTNYTQVPAYNWLAIGYLISYRILNYAYACKSLLFTPPRTMEV